MSCCCACDPSRASGAPPRASSTLAARYSRRAGDTFAGFSTSSHENGATRARWVGRRAVSGASATLARSDRTGLDGKPGDKITFTLLRKLDNAAVMGDATLKGNEERLDYFFRAVTIDQDGNAVRQVGNMSK